MEWKWPEYFPEACPPVTATNAGGVFYRLVKDPPCDEDFLSKRQQTGKFPHRNEPIDPCEWCGLSMFEHEKDAYRCQKKYGKRPHFEGRIVMQGELKPHFGRIKATPRNNAKSHYTWWLPFGIDVRELINCFGGTAVSSGEGK